MESHHDGPNTIIIKIAGGDFSIGFAIELFTFKGVFDLLFRLLRSLWFDLIWFYSQCMDFGPNCLMRSLLLVGSVA
jgi:hypothetical protein